MALRYQQSERELSLQGSILLSDGTTYALDADNIVRYSLEEASTSGESITLGDARASDYTLEIEDTAHYLTAAKLIGARVTVRIGLDGTTDPLGVWYVDKAEISRQSATVSISGTDALGSKMDGLYVDGAYPTTLGAIAARAAAQAGLTLKSSSFRNSDIVVQTQPEWDVETNTRRMVIGYVAACAGGFARISRAGVLEIVPYTLTTPETVTADYFTVLAVGGGQTFAFNCLQVAHYGSNIYVRYAIDESKTDTAGNTLRVSDNPLLTAAIAQTLKTQLSGLASAAVSVDWVGDPTMQPGMRITVQDTDGSTHTGIVTRQTISVDGGLHAQTAAELPENINSAFIDTVFTPGGKVNITTMEGRLKVWAEEQINLSVGEATDEIQTQIDLIPGKITLQVGNSENLLLNSYIDLNTSDYLVATFKLADPTLKAGETVTIQIWGQEGQDRYYWRVTNGAVVLADIYYNEKIGNVITKTFEWVKTGSNDTLYIYQLSRNMDSNASDSSYVEKVQLQRGDTPVAWAPSSLDAKSVISGSNLIITQDNVRINTPEFSVNVNGTNGDMTLDENGLSVSYIGSPSVRPMYDGPSTISVISGTIDGVNTFNSLSEALGALRGKYFSYPLTIDVSVAQTENTMELWDTDGSPITINAPSGSADSSDDTITGRLLFNYLRNQIVINNMTISYAYDNPVYLVDCYSVIMNSCTISTLRPTSYDDPRFYTNAVYAYQTNVELYKCGLYYGYGGLFIEKNARGLVYECKGSSNEYGVFARNNAQVGIVTSGPSGKASNTYSTSDSEIRGGTSTSSGSTPSAPSVTNEGRLTATNTLTHDGGGWYNANLTTKICQGVRNNGTFKGYMWFDNSALSGLTITKAFIQLFRQSGVGSGSVNVYLGATTRTSPSSGGTDYQFGKLNLPVKTNAQLKVQIPTAAVQGLANGTYKGLYIYSASESDYAAFDGYKDLRPPTLWYMY